MSSELQDYNDFEGMPIRCSADIDLLSTVYNIEMGLEEVEEVNPREIEKLRKQVELRKKCMRGLADEIEELEDLLEELT